MEENDWRWPQTNLEVMGRSKEDSSGQRWQEKHCGCPMPHQWRRRLSKLSKHEIKQLIKEIYCVIIIFLIITLIVITDIMIILVNNHCCCLCHCYHNHYHQCTTVNTPYTIARSSRLYCSDNNLIIHFIFTVQLVQYKLFLNVLNINYCLMCNINYCLINICTVWLVMNDMCINQVTKIKALKLKHTCLYPLLLLSFVFSRPAVSPQVVEYFY